jgi:hypothetical protein
MISFECFMTKCGRANTMRTTWAILGGMLALSMAGSVNAVPFFTDEFEYADGALATTSSGAWVTHSGLPNQIQVVDEKAVFYTRLGGNAGNPPTQTPIDEDVNRAANSTLAPGSTWYYAATFTIDDNRVTPGTGTIGTEYFMHFKDSGTFNLRGRLYVTPGSTATSYKLGVTSSSGSLTAPSTWGSDLAFGQEYTVVVSYQASLNDPVEMIEDPLDPPNMIPNPFFTGPLQPGDGYASLWVNPSSISSTKVTDTNPANNVATDVQASMAMNSLALRQGGSGTQVGSPAKSTSSVKFNVDTVSIGSDFDEVLNAVGGPVTPTDDADFDGDGDVDGQDFLTWQRGLGALGSGELATGDANGDLDIDADDLAVWKTQFSASAATPAVGAVPEPACLALAACGALAALATGRRRGR